MSADAGVRRMLGGSVERLIANEDAVIRGEDDEAVHQARVGVRRLRSDLATLRPILREEATLGRRRPDLRWLGRRLGRARDADVQLERLRAGLDRLSDRDHGKADRLVKEYVGRRDDAHGKLVHAMGGDRFARLRDAIVAFASTPSLRDPTAPAVEVFRPLMRERWQALREAAEALSDGSSDDELHRVRILTKRARYAADGFASVFGDDARRFAKLAAALQDLLGEHQDATVASALLRRAARSAPKDTVFVAGELFAGETRARELARQGWPRAWRSLAAGGPRFW